MVKDISETAEPRLPWAGKRVQAAQVDEELAHLWRMATDNVRTSQNINVRTSVLNLVVCVTSIEAAQRASALIRDLSSTHIARVMILILDSSAPDRVATWITTRSFPVISDVMRHTFEQVTLMVHGSAVRSIASIAQPLLKPQLPVYLWWLNDPPSDPALFGALSELSTRIVIDSGSFGTPEASILTLSTLAQRFPNTELSDFNWGRLTPWRELVAQFFDANEYRPYLAGLHTIEIEHAVNTNASSRGEISPNSTCALLLAGWLEMQLGWLFDNNKFNTNDEHNAATGTHLWNMSRQTGPLPVAKVNTSSSRATKTGSKTQAVLSIRPRECPDVRPGALCMVRMTGMAGNRRAIFTINREESLDNVVTSVVLENETRPQRTVRAAANRKTSELLHDELEIISRDHLYEEALQEVRELLS